MAPGNASYIAPTGFMTSTDHSGALLIVNLIGLVLALASIIVRVFISHRGTGNGLVMYNDDLFCFAAMVSSIIVFALGWAGFSEGNGKLVHLISPTNLVHVQQIQYATDMFYIISLFCSRSSMVFLLERVQSNYTNRVWRSFFGFVSVWAVASVFMIALKCDLHRPWIQYNAQCTGLLARWYAIEIFGIVIEGTIFAGVIYLVYSVRMKSSAKLKVVLLFGTRAVVIIFAALRLLKLHSYTESANPTYTGIPAAVYGLAEMFTSIITATSPLVKSFLVEFNVVGNRPTLVLRRKYGANTNRDNDAVPSPQDNARRNIDMEKTSGTEKSTGSRSEQSTTTTVNSDPDWASHPPVMSGAMGGLGGSLRSANEPWTRRHECSYAETNVTSTFKDDGSETTTLRDNDKIKVVTSFKVSMDGN